MADPIRDKLIKIFRAKAWNNLSFADLDTGLAELTKQEKTLIIESLKAEDDRAKVLIKTKLVEGLQAYAEQAADDVIAAGVIPIDLISDKL